MYAAIIITSLICLALTFCIAIAVYVPLWIRMVSKRSIRTVRFLDAIGAFGTTLLGLIYAQVHYVVSGDRLILFLASSAHFIFPVISILIALRFVSKTGNSNAATALAPSSNDDELEMRKEAANA